MADTPKPNYDTEVGFLTTHAKVNEKGDTLSATQGSYLDFLKTEHQIEPGTVKSLANAQDRVLNAMVLAGAAQLEPRIVEAKKNGDDPSDLKSKVTVATPLGRMEVTVIGQRTVNNPQAKTSQIQHGAVKGRIVVNSHIDDDVYNQTKERIAKAMGV